jgi:hypothetical protein
VADSPIRTKHGANPKSEHAIKAKQWLLENHERLEQQYGLPRGSLVALSHHESKFDPYALSPTGALGAFQFTRNTAKGYGLKIGGDDDERFNIEKSSEAAAKYLSDLQKKFGNITHSFAQWNGGWKAVDAVKEKKVKEYKSINGRYELSGFLEGVRNSAKELGYDNIYDEIEYGVFSEKKEEPFDPTANPPTSGSESLMRGFQPSIDEWRRREALKKHAGTSPIVFTKHENKHPFVVNDRKAKIDMANANDYHLMKSLAEDYRMYSGGGSLLQLTGDSDNVELILKGVERIFSRPDTKKLMELAKKATDSNGFYLLGKFLYDATKKQDSRPPETKEIEK